MKLRRPGQSLIELLVIITLVSGALGLAATTLTALIRTEARLRRDREERLSMSRLAELWRADAHAAVACRADQVLQFTLADGRHVRYSLEGTRIRREVRRGDQVVHRDSFAVAKQAAATLAVQTRHDREFAQLTIERRSDSSSPSASQRTTRLEALVNLHRQPQTAEAQP